MFADDPKQFETIEEFLNQDDPTPADDDETKPPAGDDNPEGSDGDVDPEDTGDDAGDDTGDEGESTKTRTPKTSNPMRELRDRANAATRQQKKVDDALHRFTEGDYEFRLRDFRNEEGKLDYDALIAAMDESDVKARAQAKGLSPEIQAEIERYEKEKREVEIAKARVEMDRKLNNFQVEQNMTSDDLNNFIADSMKMGINPLTIAVTDKTPRGTAALKMLYRAVYVDDLIKDAVDSALEEERAKQQSADDATGKKPKSNPAPTNTSKTDPSKDNKKLAFDEFLDLL